MTRLGDRCAGPVTPTRGVVAQGRDKLSFAAGDAAKGGDVTAAVSDVSLPDWAGVRGVSCGAGRPFRARIPSKARDNPARKFADRGPGVAGAALHAEQSRMEPFREAVLPFQGFVHVVH